VTTERSLVIAAALLRITPEQATTHHVRLEPDAATRYTHPVRGGGACLVADDGTVYFVPSAQDPAEALREFRSGVRHDVPLPPEA
jgi:hypothetical protein